MRVTLTGKGGAGKSTLAGLLCWTLAGRGERVVAVDADPVPGLAEVLGIDAGEGWYLAEAAVKRENEPGWDLTMTAAEALERYAVTGPRGIRFLQLGNVGSELTGDERAGMVAFGRMVPEFDHSGQWVVVDTFGGTLQATAGWTGALGVVLVVVEPFTKSVMTAARLANLAQWQPGLRLLAVGSKVRTEEDRRRLVGQLEELGIPLWAEFPPDPAVTDAERAGTPLTELPPDGPAMTAAAAIADRLATEILRGLTPPETVANG